jgi:hypothetical protein
MISILDPALHTFFSLQQAQSRGRDNVDPGLVASRAWDGWGRTGRTHGRKKRGILWRQLSCQSGKDGLHIFLSLIDVYYIAGLVPDNYGVARRLDAVWVERRGGRVGREAASRG